MRGRLADWLGRGQDAEVVQRLHESPLKVPAAAETTGVLKSLGQPPNVRANTARHVHILIRHAEVRSAELVHRTQSRHRIAHAEQHQHARGMPTITKVTSHGTASSVLPSHGRTHPQRWPPRRCNGARAAPERRTRAFVEQ